MIKNYIICSQILIALLLWSYSFEPVQAQERGIGVKGSYASVSHLNNFRFLQGDIDLDFTPGFVRGFNAGLVFRRPISEGLRFQAEPSIALMGAKYEDNFNFRGFNFRTDSRTNLTYFQVPLVLQISTVPPQRNVYGLPFTETTYHFTGGIFGGYLLNAQFSGANSGAPVGVEFQGGFSENVTDQYADFDAGIVVGAGFERGYSSKFGMETRFMMGVLNSGDLEAANFEPRNMAITVGAYIVF